MRDLLDRNAFPEKRWIKLQVTGPGILWNSFFSKEVEKDETPLIRSHLRRILMVSGLAQIQRIHLYGRHPLMVIDDPFFWYDLEGVKEMFSVFRSAGAIVGLHLCSSLTHLEDLKDLEMDLFHFDSRLWKGTPSENLFLHQFLKQGGWVAWGIIPTPMGVRLDTQDFCRSLRNQMKNLQKRGWSLEEILEHSLLAPACGTGTLTPEEDREVARSLFQTAEELRSSYFHC